MMTLTSNFALKYTSVSKLPRAEIPDFYSIDLFCFGQRSGRSLNKHNWLT